MLDKKSKELLNYLSTCKSNQHFYHDPFPKNLGKADDIFANIRYLKSIGYIEAVTGSNGSNLGIRLSHVATHRKEFSLMATIEYIKDKWVDIAALVISILAFIGAYRNEITALKQKLMK